MTKLELIESLRLMNDDEEIFVSVRVGDYWGHVKLEAIHDVGPVLSRYSHYLESLESIPDDEIDSDGAKFVWALELRG